MDTLTMARRLAQLGSIPQALKGFELALRTQPDLPPQDVMEAALFVLHFSGDYRLAYDAFLRLHHQGDFPAETASLMTEAFYLPNEKTLRARYEKNCKALKKYKLCFRDDFPPFEQLPIRFYPYDDARYVPVEGDVFGDVTDYKEPVVTRNFFANLEDPILAEDVFSQYELEYLNDNVRPSEWVGRENHVYLYYSQWPRFCAYLQVLNLRRLLADEKLVFLFEDERGQYPIDFQARFGIDYSKYPVRPVGLREVNRLIWHTQLSYHNGGDFFNEVLDGHPNLVSSSSIMNDSMERTLDDIRSTLDDAKSMREIAEVFDEQDWGDPRMIQEAYLLRDRTDKDILVAYFFRDMEHTHHLDPAARISPAIMYQPHFGHINCQLNGDGQGRAIMSSSQFDAIKQSPVFRNFKYVKTFTPMRRITTSYAAAMRFMADQPERNAKGNVGVIRDEVVNRISFRGYMMDGQDRLFKDCVVARFEDAKLNPNATFRALAAFLDLPYTESMKRCTFGGVPMSSLEEASVDFDTAPVYRTYDDYATDAERCYLEYFLRDAYEFYGYDFHYYDGGLMTEERVRELIRHFDVLNHYMFTTMGLGYQEAVRYTRSQEKEAGLEKEYAQTVEEEAAEKLEAFRQETMDQRLLASQVLMKGLTFVNEEGRPLRFMPLLKLDPALLEQPLYR